MQNLALFMYVQIKCTSIICLEYIYVFWQLICLKLLILFPRNIDAVVQIINRIKQSFRKQSSTTVPKSCCQIDGFYFLTRILRYPPLQHFSVAPASDKRTEKEKHQSEFFNGNGHRGARLLKSLHKPVHKSWYMRAAQRNTFHIAAAPTWGRVCGDKFRALCRVTSRSAIGILFFDKKRARPRAVCNTYSGYVCAKRREKSFLEKLPFSLTLRFSVCQLLYHFYY